MLNPHLDLNAEHNIRQLATLLNECELQQLREFLVDRQIMNYKLRNALCLSLNSQPLPSLARISLKLEQAFQVRVIQDEIIGTTERDRAALIKAALILERWNLVCHQNLLPPSNPVG
jgi:hypothetical protein